MEGVRQFCPTCYTLYYACPGCQFAICDCDTSECICNDGEPLQVLNAYLDEYEIPEAIKEKQDAEL